MFDTVQFRLRIMVSILVRHFLVLLNSLLKKTGKNEHWSSPVSWYCPNGFKVYWETLEAVGKYQNKMMTGDRETGHLQYTMEFLKKNVGTHGLAGLSIGCGADAAPEMALFETGYFSSFEVMDIAEGLLNKQEKVAKLKGLSPIKYLKKDLNRVVLEPEKYDLIWALGTIHHIEKLEELFRQIRRGLKSNGIFVIREYVGPDRLQLTDDQLRRTNEILSTLPVKYKRKWHGFPKNKENRIDVMRLMRSDPSEAVRSSEIMNALKKELQIVHFAKTGGTLLHPLLNGIAANFEIVPGGEAALNDIIEKEKQLIENDTIPSDYVFCIAKKPVGSVETTGR